MTSPEHPLHSRLLPQPKGLPEKTKGEDGRSEKADTQSYTSQVHVHVTRSSKNSHKVQLKPW